MLHGVGLLGVGELYRNMLKDCDMNRVTLYVGCILTGKSHYCVVEYLKENYLKTCELEQKLIHWLGTYRIERHETHYGLEHLQISAHDESTAIDSVKTFLDAVKRLAEA